MSKRKQKVNKGTLRRVLELIRPYAGLVVLTLVLAVATSIDALAVGVTFSMVELSVSIWMAVCLIGCTTFLISLGGVYVGNVFGAKYKNKAEFVGGTILILIGVKIILEHFGVL